MSAAAQLQVVAQVRRRAHGALRRTAPHGADAQADEQEAGPSSASVHPSAGRPRKPPRARCTKAKSTDAAGKDERTASRTIGHTMERARSWLLQVEDDLARA